MNTNFSDSAPLPPGTAGEIFADSAPLPPGTVGELRSSVLE